MFYPHTLEQLVLGIKARFPDATADEMRDDSRLENYLLWMIEQIGQMGEKDSKKAARWLGWVLCMAEEKLRLLDNSVSRDMVRVDVRNGDD